MERKRFRDSERGFTLMELLIVMVILGLLAALVGPKLFGKVGKAKVKTAKAQIALLETALDEFRLDVGRYPTTEEGLKALIESPGAKGWDGPYLKKRKVPEDPWGNPYHYKCPGDHGEYDLYSLGRDGKPGGTGEDADITSWE